MSTTLQLNMNLVCEVLMKDVKISYSLELKNIQLCRFTKEVTFTPVLLVNGKPKQILKEVSAVNGDSVTVHEFYVMSMPGEFVEACMDELKK